MFALQSILTEIKLQNLEPHEVSVAVDLSSFTFTEVGTKPHLGPNLLESFSPLLSKRSSLESLEHFPSRVSLPCFSTTPLSLLKSCLCSLIPVTNVMFV